MADLLIVDDDSDLADLLAETLRAEGHAVRVAHDGREGLRRSDEQPPDLVLLDVEMPRMSGPGMAHQLLLHDCGLEKVPIVLVSGLVDLPRIAELVGTPYFLPKPYDAEAILEVVERALAERVPPMPLEGAPRT